MTYNEICMALSNAQIENNRGEASMLICHFCGINQAELLGRRDEDFSCPELVAAVKRRCEHYPLQYILGYWEFCRETYRVTEDTLIPRQDTEKLVELAVKLLPEGARFISLISLIFILQYIFLLMQQIITKNFRLDNQSCILISYFYGYYT